MDEDVPKLGPPAPECEYYTLGRRYLLEKRVIFTFGSNLKGIHGAGAAVHANRVFRAQYGIGVGFTGNAYAIPTKRCPKDRLKLKQIQAHIQRFIEVTDLSMMDLPHERRFFYVTPIGTGLAGYRHEDIAPLFRGVCNCWLPDVWKPYLGSRPDRYI